MVPPPWCSQNNRYWNAEEPHMDKQICAQVARHVEGDIDFLAPYFARIGNPETITQQQALKIRKDCISDFKHLLTERMNRIQENFEKREGRAFLDRIIAFDETWARSYEPELKCQSNEWCHPSSPQPKKLRQEPGNVKVMLIVAYDKIPIKQQAGVWRPRIFSDVRRKEGRSGMDSWRKSIVMSPQDHLGMKCVKRVRLITEVLVVSARGNKLIVDGNSEGGCLLAFASRETDRDSKAAYNIATSYFTSTCNTNSAGENLNYQKTIMTLAVDYCKHDTKQTLFPSLTIFFARFSIPHMLLQLFLARWQHCCQHQDGWQHCAP
ncbi:hypothetical protein ANN_17722 [Periplaneta americana]|uniref:Dynein regulatory complex subunit 7 C-terminal domain-containing protein n=1 Tax=Periplaneta americana TaxID=6978 RepID=A0ABQ8STV2_PERAM|nr:hypothetical protein ANN_17722 [Periplaneta americana]